MPKTEVDRVRAVRLALALAGGLLAGCAATEPASNAPDSRGAAAPPAPIAAVATDEPIDRDWMRAHYEKTETLVAMRDGVRLHTVVYRPRHATGPMPILLRRTPYSCRPYGEDAYPNGLGVGFEPFLRDGYAIAFQDVRGCYLSEGTFVNMRPHVAEKSGPDDIDESTDTYDTIEWLVANVRGNNGRVGLWGISYPGFYSAAGMIDAHPALKAVSPQAPIADWWYDDFKHHGAFFLPHGFNFLSRFGLPRPEPSTSRPPRPFEFGTPDGYDFFLNEMGPLPNANEKFLRGQVAFWNELVAHPDRDEWWEAMNIVPHLSNVAPAVMVVGGWFDAEDLYGPLSIYQSVEARNPGVENHLVMGPWRHGGWHRTDGNQLGNVHFGEPTSPWYRAEIEKPFFDHHLRGGPDPELAEAIVFETGRNRWRFFDDWPPADVEPRWLHFRADGGLSAAPPAAEGFDEFRSDPAKPVPFTEDVAIGMTREYMTDDQRFASRRPDVLVYRTGPLDEDLTIAGPLLAELIVSTTGEDADWVVKLIDVHPGDHPDYPGIRQGMRTGGYQMMVRSEVIRGRYRNSASDPEPFVPGEPTLVRLPLQDVLHTFKAGHELMIQVQSTWFPLVDRNPQSWVENIFLADEEDFVPADHRVHRRPEGATSRIRIGVLPGG